ncbi:hypothetical protein B0H13DRAFT_1591252, partial [Mycena leptocephala]
VAPPTFLKYLDQYWTSDQVVKMWSAIYKRDRTIFEACDTNMLIEAYAYITNLTTFETTIIHIFGGRHVDGYRTGAILCPPAATSPTAPTDWASPTLDRSRRVGPLHDCAEYRGHRRAGS